MPRIKRSAQVSGAKNLEDLHRKLIQVPMVRRRKIDVLKQLPRKQRQRVILKLPPGDTQKLSKGMARRVWPDRPPRALDLAPAVLTFFHVCAMLTAVCCPDADLLYQGCENNARTVLIYNVLIPLYSTNERVFGGRVLKN